MSQQRARLQRALHGETQDVIEAEDDITSTLADLTAEMCATSDRDIATEILDRGRSILLDDELSELAGTYAQLFDDKD